MKLSRKWLNEFVELGAVGDREFAEGMTLSGSKGEGIYYVNQLGYPHVYYYHNAEGGGVREDRRNIGTSGCGLCCAAMALGNLTGVRLTPEEMSHIVGITQRHQGTVNEAALRDCIDRVRKTAQKKSLDSDEDLLAYRDRLKKSKGAIQ